MKLLPCLVLAAALALAGTASAQTNVRVRGTITAVEANALLVKSRDGRDLKLMLPDNAAVTVTKAARFEDLKAGDLVGATTNPGPDGTPVAAEVHYLPPTVAESQFASDLRPGSTMTNAPVDSVVVGTGARELTLKLKTGNQRVLVPEGTPVVRAVPGTRADLAAGEYLFANVQVAGDGTMTAPRIQVSKDGVRPPQ
jgi:hypothetical protein